MWDGLPEKISPWKHPTLQLPKQQKSLLEISGDFCLGK